MKFFIDCWHAFIPLIIPPAYDCKCLTHDFDGGHSLAVIFIDAGRHGQKPLGTLKVTSFCLQRLYTRFVESATEPQAAIRECSVGAAKSLLSLVFSPCCLEYFSVQYVYLGFIRQAASRLCQKFTEGGLAHPPVVMPVVGVAIRYHASLDASRCRRHVPRGEG